MQLRQPTLWVNNPLVLAVRYIAVSNVIRFFSLGWERSRSQILKSLLGPPGARVTLQVQICHWCQVARVHYQSIKITYYDKVACKICTQKYRGAFKQCKWCTSGQGGASITGMLIRSATVTPQNPINSYRMTVPQAHKLLQYG